MLTPDSRPLSATPPVNDVRDSDFVPVLRLSEPDPADQNVRWTVARLTAYLAGVLTPTGGGGGGTTLPANVVQALLAAAGPGASNAFATEQELDALAATGPNDRPDGFKSVRFLTRADPRFDPASDQALDELDTVKGCLGTTCYVDFEAVRYVLRYDGAPRTGGPASGPQCWRDGRMAFPTPLVPCQWVREDAPGAGLKAYPEYPAGYDFAVDTYVSAYVAGQASEQFFKARGPRGPRPAPTAGGDAVYWELVSATDVPANAPYAPVATLSESKLLALYAAGGLEPYAGKLLRITGRSAAPGDAGGPVRVPVNAAGALATSEAYLHESANPEGPGVPVTLSVTASRTAVAPRTGYDDTALRGRVSAVETDVSTLSARAAGYVYKGLFPTGTATAVKKNEVYTSAASVPFEAKSDFTATAEPAANAFWAAHGFVVQPQLAATTTRVTALETTNEELPTVITLVVEDTLASYNTYALGVEIENPPLTYGMTNFKGFQAGHNLSYFFSAGGPVRLHAPTTGFSFTVISIRLAANATQPLVITPFAQHPPISFTVQPGEKIVLSLLPPNVGTVGLGGGFEWSLDARTPSNTPGRNLYGSLTQAEENAVKALFTTATQHSAPATNYTATNAPYGITFPDFANGGVYTLMPNRAELDANGKWKPYWMRTL